MTDQNLKIEQATWIFERTLGWIATADVKAGVAMGLDAAMIGGLAAAFSASDPSSRTVWCNRIVVLAALGQLAAIFCLAKAAVPRMQGPVKSVIFFGKIAERNEEDYVAELLRISEKDFFTDLARQVHRNALIAKEKHHWIRRSLFCSIVSVIPWIASIAMLVKK